MEPLAYRLRPTTFKEIYGHANLISENGILTNMIKNEQYSSVILYGPPGCGKTSIAKVFANTSTLEPFFFNASTDKKDDLKEAVLRARFYNLLLIIDEIHRMKTDIQDFLLPYIESGLITIIGLTTLNPYRSINPAIRSRCRIYEIKSLTPADLEGILERTLSYLSDIEKKFYNLTSSAKELLINMCDGEARTLINIIEAISISLDNHAEITSEDIKKVCGKKNIKLDSGQDNYYRTLSALQKSIRGSDVDAALHYAARLYLLEDIDILFRRLLVIAYEDIGLANPSLPQKVLTAYEVFKLVGHAEAPNIIGPIIIELAISPKSNSALSAFNLAIEELQNTDTGDIPAWADNNMIRLNPSIYKYAHDYPNSINDQNYLPIKIKKRIYYKAKRESNYETALANRVDILRKLKKK